MKRIFLFFLASGAIWAQNAGTPMSLVTIVDDNLLPGGGKVGGDCTNYSIAYFNVVQAHSVACVNTNPLTVTNVGKWTVTSGGTGGSNYAAGTGLTLTGNTFAVKYGAAAATATEGNDARIGAGGGTSYTAGTGLTLTGNAFSVNYGTSATTAAAGNDSRITSALNGSSSLNATNLLTGTVPAARLPVPTASTLGGVQAVNCAASSFVSTISTAGVPGCTVGSGGAGGPATIPVGTTAAGRPATTNGTGSFYIQTDRNVGDQLTYFNGTSWYYPGGYDSTMTRDAATGNFGINVAAVPRLATANNFTALNHFTSVQLDSCKQADGTTNCFGTGSNTIAIQQDSAAQGAASTLNFGAGLSTVTAGGTTNITATATNPFTIMNQDANPTINIDSPNQRPLHLNSSGPRTQIYVTNTNSTPAGVHDWDMSSTPGYALLWYDDTGNFPILALTNDGLRFKVGGGPQLNQNGFARPACDVDSRATLWFTSGGASKDGLFVCAYDGAAYAWRTIY